MHHSLDPVKSGQRNLLNDCNGSASGDPGLGFWNQQGIDWHPEEHTLLFIFGVVLSKFRKVGLLLGEIKKGSLKETTQQNKCLFGP
mmetsp:Transcript_1737/g.3474  ORF Transcript_1737/g.3474 Transcript_1737/m.3474 type:complete len:86 (+) Transcript_1737:616-873(+)